MMRHHLIFRDTGFAMLTVMLYTFVAVVMVGGVLTAVLTSVHVADAFEDARMALEAAEYGEGQAVMLFMKGEAACLGLAEWDGVHTGVGLPILDGAPGAAPLPVPAVQGAVYAATTSTLRAMHGLPDYVVVRASGRCGNVARHIEAIYRWTNAESADGMRKFVRISWREL